MLSLIELQRKKVEAKRKKYDKDEMDSYLELVYENYRELLDQVKTLEAEKAELNQKVKKLSDGVQYYRSIETTLQKALILAEKTSKETKDAALLKAESIEKDANKRADEILRNAEGEYNKIKGKCVHLVQQFNQYKTRLIEAASAQLELVEGDEFDIEAPDEYVIPARYHEPKDSGQAVQRLMALKTPPSCILFPDDTCYLGGQTALEKMGLSIPENVSCFGYDGIRLAGILRPRLSTYRQNAQGIGKRAAAELISAIELPKFYAPQIVMVAGSIQEGDTVKDLTDASAS